MKDCSRDIGRGMASLGICGLGAFSMWITHGDTGIGWAFLALILLWC